MGNDELSIGVIALVFGVPVFLFVSLVLLMGGRKGKEEKLLSRLIDRHELALISNWNRVVYTDEYGTTHYDKWPEEVSRFIESSGFQHSSLNRSEVLNFVTEKIAAKVARMKRIKNYLETGDPYDFERKCAELLKKYGWEAMTTKKSGDQGADILATKNGKSVAIQCKLHSKPVGNKAVQEALSGKLFNSVGYAAVVASNGYTHAAKQLAQKTDVVLLTSSSLSKLEKYI